jgi:shikimate dehydrogenase
MIKKKFGIIGKPLSHSLSPALHNYWFKKYKIKANYTLIELERNKIETLIKRIKKGEIQGINVTVPFKQAVIPYLDLIVDDAAKTQSVNTISLNNQGQVIGNNTDVYGIEQGFLNKLDKSTLKQSRILILGAGGVSPSVVYALLKKKVKKIYVANRTLEKAKDLKKKFSFVEIIEWENIESQIEKMEIIINATSLGLKGGSEFAEDFKNIKSNLIYFDIVYNPQETTMTKIFLKRGVRTFNGLEMFIYQGQKSFFLWNKIKPSLDEKLKQIIISNLK